MPGPYPFFVRQLPTSLRLLPCGPRPISCARIIPARQAHSRLMSGMCIRTYAFLQCRHKAGQDQEAIALRAM